MTGPATPTSGSTAATNATIPIFMSAETVDSIGVRMAFDLTPGEKATFIGVFALLPAVPPGNNDGDTGHYTIFLCGASPAVQTINAKMDIKPGACPNPFNPTSNGVLPVSLLGTSSFDVHNVNLSSVRLSRSDGVGGQVAPNEGPPGPHSTYEDNGTPFEGIPCNCNTLHGDGLTDLSMKFRSDQIVQQLHLDQLPGGSTVELKLTGAMNDLTTFTARDCVWIVPPHLNGDSGLVQVRCALNDNWIDVDPPDGDVDGGGFSNFDRRYPPGASVTLTAPAFVEGSIFAGWRIDGAKKLIARSNLTIIAIIATTAPHRYEAVYLPVLSGH